MTLSAVLTRILLIALVLSGAAVVAHSAQAGEGYEACFAESTKSREVFVRVSSEKLYVRITPNAPVAPFENLAVFYSKDSEKQSAEFGVEDDGGHAIVTFEEGKLNLTGLQGYPMTLVKNIPECDRNSTAYDPSLKCTMRLSTKKAIQALPVNCN